MSNFPIHYFVHRDPTGFGERETRTQVHTILRSLNASRNAPQSRRTELNASLDAVSNQLIRDK